MIDLRALERLQDMLGGDPADVAEIVESLLGEAPALLAEMQDAAGRGDLAALGRAAHSLKSNARDVGADTLAALCQSVESAVRSGQGPEDPAAAAAAILAEWKGVAPELDDIVRRRGQTS
jgi:histidine phosphotransfer protein HptB